MISHGIWFVLGQSGQQTSVKCAEATWNYKVRGHSALKGALDKFNIIPQLFPKKVGIFITLEVLAWVMTACRVLHSRLTYF